MVRRWEAPVITAALWGAAHLLGATVGTAILPGVLQSQTRGAGSPGVLVGPMAGALPSWSVLAPLADLPRAFPARGPGLAGLLEGGEAQVGLFWNGGNPGALPFEVEGTRSEYGLARESVSGEYRRPFDSGEESTTRAAAGGWRRLGTRGAGVAAAVLDDASYRNGVFSDVVRPYTSSPYVVADTSRADLAQISARLEAAGGWQLGSWGLGVGVGFQGQESRSVSSPVPRKSHSSGPGVSVGVVKAFGKSSLRLGAFGKWQSLNETTIVYTVAAPTLIYQIDGYVEAPPARVSNLYWRWFEREAWMAGGGLSGNAWGARWTLWGSRSALDEQQSNERIQGARTDAWRAWSNTLGGAVQRQVFGRAVLTGTVRWTGLDGEAEPAPDVNAGEDPPEDPVVFRADEEAVDGTLEVRTTLGSGLWELAATLAVRQEWRDRTDTRNRARSNLDMRTLGASFEVLRSLTEAFAVTAGGNLLAYDPVGGIPDPSAMGPVYNRWLAPELALLGTRARAKGLTLGARWIAGPGRMFWLRLATASFTPGGSAYVLPLVPEGDRQSWNLSLGVTLGGE